MENPETLGRKQAKLIGAVTVTPEIVVPGQSVLIEVKDPSGNSFADNGEVSVRINGTLGARQYLQFDSPREKTILVTASRGKTIEKSLAKVTVLSPRQSPSGLNSEGFRIFALSRHPALKKPPILHFARAPHKPYLAAFSVGRDAFSRGLSRQGRAGIAPDDQAGKMAGVPVEFRPLDPETITFPATFDLSKGLAGARILHKRKESGQPQLHLKRSPWPAFGRPEGEANDSGLVATPVPGGILIEPVPKIYYLDPDRPAGADNRLVYHYDFGDGSKLTTHSPVVEHDFESALDPDEEHHTFHIKVRIEERGQPSVEVVRTLYIHNAYALCKKRGFIVPRANVTTYATKALHGWEGMVTIDNVEPESLALHSRLICPLLEEEAEGRRPVWTEQPLRAPVIVPPKGSVSIPVTVPSSLLPAGALGYSVVYCGTSAAGRAIRVETCFELGPKYRDPVFPRNPNLAMIGEISLNPYLDVLRKRVAEFSQNAREPEQEAASPSDRIASGLAHYRTAMAPKGTLPESVQAIALFSVIDKANRGRLFSNLGRLSALATGELSLRQGAELVSSLKGLGLLDEKILLMDKKAPSPPREGEECDPSNLPDDIYNDPETDWVCQATPETRPVLVPGRFVNARKGDIVLTPGGPSLIGQLLQQVSPPQRYSHSGIMTRNYDQITHSTASEDRILDYPVGDILGNPAPTDGHRPDVVKYCWPGVVTQKVDDSIHGVYMTDPENGNPYRISGFTRGSTGSNIGGIWEIVHPLVIKPDPLLEAKDPNIRMFLRKVASAALAETGKGHYRFYAYTDPTIAADAGKVAPQAAGWASGTWPSVCSSFIWHMLKKNGARLEGDNPVTKTDDLEDIDRAAGAQVGPATRDGLYLYSAAERLAGGEYLYNELVKKVEKSLEEKSGDILDDIIDLLSDMSDDVANQIVNTFASDWSDTAAKDSDNWKKTSSANAVSPDNMLFWDSPERKGLYGYPTPLLYREPRLETVTIHKWRKVRVKGTVWGFVRYNGQAQPRAVVQLNDQHTTLTDKNGRYSLEHVHYGDYEAKASTDLVNGIRLSASVPFHLSNPVQRLDIDLKPPSESYRRLIIGANLFIYDNHAIGGDPRNQENHYRELYLGPERTHEEMSPMVTTTDEGENRAVFKVVADLNPDDNSIIVQFSLIEHGENQRFHSGKATVGAGQWWAGQINLGHQDTGHDHCRVQFKFTNQVNPV